MIRNLAQVKAALRKAGAAKITQMGRGLFQAGLYLQAQSQKIVPVDYGILKASAFTRIEGQGTKKVNVIVGYTAKYAIFVHESLDAAHGTDFNIKYAAELAAAKRARKAGTGGTTGPFRHNRGAGQQAKFLELPLRRDRATLLAIVANEVKK